MAAVDLGEASRHVTAKPVEHGLRVALELEVAIPSGRGALDPLQLLIGHGEHATDLIHAAGTGITLALAATPPEERDPRLSQTMREAILTAITIPAAAETQTKDPTQHQNGSRGHAVALRALLTEASDILSPAERQLLSEWLDRLAATPRRARSPRRLM